MQLFSWYHLCRRSIWLGAKLFFHIRHTGLENIPTEGPVVVAANHQSHLDPPLVGCAITRDASYVARDSLFRFRPFGALIGSLHAIPIDREGRTMGGIKETLRRLKAGDVVVLFPEGTRSSDGEVHTFKPGFASLAQRSKAAIVPAAIAGAFEAWPRSQRFPHPRKIVVHFSPPIPPEQVANTDEKELVAEVERRVRGCYAMLCSAQCLGPYGADAPGSS